MTDTPMDPKRKTVLQLCCVILTMGTLAWASVPLYDLFCRLTGCAHVGVSLNLPRARLISYQFRHHFCIRTSGAGQCGGKPGIDLRL